MSAVSSRPRVRTLRACAAPIQHAALGLTSAPLGALSLEAQRALASCLDALAVRGELETLEAPALVQKVQGARRAQVTALVAAAELPELDSSKLKALLEPLTAPLAVRDAGTLHAAVARVVQAPDTNSVRAAADQLQEVLQAQHREAFEDAAQEACVRASARVGFASARRERRAGLARVIALDDAGHALVCEIHVDAAGVASLDSEVLGFTDGRCQDVLDRFNRELENDGLRADTPRRRGTGGRAVLASSAEILAGERSADAVQALVDQAIGPRARARAHQREGS